MMTAPNPPTPLSTQYGNLLLDDAGSSLRYAWNIFGALAAWGMLASIFQGSFGGFLFWGAVCAAFWGYFYYALRGTHAQIYEHGFLISRGGKTTSARWDEIAKVEHWVKTTRYAFIPVSRSHSYTVFLISGEQVKVSWWFKNEKKLGSIFEQMWAASVVRRNKSM